MGQVLNHYRTGTSLKISVWRQDHTVNALLLIFYKFDKKKFKNSWKCQNCTENNFQYSSVSLPFTCAVAMFQYSCTVKNLQHSPAACDENSLLYTRIEIFSYTTRVKKAMSGKRPNSNALRLQISKRKIVKMTELYWKLFSVHFWRFHEFLQF